MHTTLKQTAFCRYVIVPLRTLICLLFSHCFFQMNPYNSLLQHQRTVSDMAGYCCPPPVWCEGAQMFQLIHIFLFCNTALCHYNSVLFQLAVSFWVQSCLMEQFTTSKIISPRRVGVITWVFLLSARYLILHSFLRISALVALVPIPQLLIWARSSSSSIS